MPCYFQEMINAQILDPVDYAASIKQISENVVELQVTATMDEGWHIYSVNTSKESMVIGTELNIPASAEAYELVGKVKGTRTTYRI